jgi:hypothetical protein
MGRAGAGAGAGAGAANPPAPSLGEVEVVPLDNSLLLTPSLGNCASMLPPEMLKRLFAKYIYSFNVWFNG